MIVAPYREGYNFDVFFERFIPLANRNSCVKRNDDLVFLCIGEPGTGKTMLGLHAYSLIAEHPKINYIGMDEPGFARALSDVIKEPRGVRFLNYDEGFLSRRNWASKWNKDIIDLYKRIRGQNIFHWLNTPTAHDMDKDVLMRVDYLIYIFTKTTSKPRLYIVFDNTENGRPAYILQKIVEEYGDLSYKSLMSAAKKYSLWQGWFKDYKGNLRASYDRLKEKRGVFSIENFTEKWGNTDLLSETKAAAHLGISRKTVQERIRRYLAQGLIHLDTDIVVNNIGQYRLKDEGLVKLRDLITLDHNKRSDKRVL